MSRLFIDTSGWASLFIPTESFHIQAAHHFAQAQKQYQSLITTNYIVTELVALLSIRQCAPRNTLFQYIDSIRTASIVEVIHIDAATDTTAWELCKSRPDKVWSLVDCTSFVIMQRSGIQNALTTDHHFEQAGYVRLLKR
ncbi:type II toxin-antitoxin system VapC family toxin [Egbenema bharatensis]|uniref:type II toxin-antitoxin system VapC family toxin n=1 Tax=Egbenema bharatensis TaxID=3463334 RepID=UPI003A8B31C9